MALARCFKPEQVVFKFDELSKEAQDRAIEDHGNFLTQEWTPECDMDYWKEELSKQGFIDAVIHYSIGGYDGTAGASFEAENDDAYFYKKFFKTIKKQYVKKTRRIKMALPQFIIEKDSSRYSHRKTCRVSLDDYCGGFDYEDFINCRCGDNEFRRVCFQAVYGTESEFVSVIDDLKDFIEAKREELCDKIFKDLQADYEWQAERENVIEGIKGNDYDFDEDGRIV